jgi:hypothetical protein
MCRRSQQNSLFKVIQPPLDVRPIPLVIPTSAVRQSGHPDLLDAITRRHTSTKRSFDEISSAPHQADSKPAQEAISTACGIDNLPS